LTSKDTFRMNNKEYSAYHYIVTDKIHNGSDCNVLSFYYKEDSKDRYEGWRTKVGLDIKVVEG